MEPTQFLLDTLASLGGAAQHDRLKAALQWDDDTYTSTKDALLAQGKLLKRRGRGGGVKLPDYVSGSPSGAAKDQTSPAE